MAPRSILRERYREHKQNWEPQEAGDRALRGGGIQKHLLHFRQNSTYRLTIIGCQYSFITTPHLAPGGKPDTLAKPQERTKK